jgi:AcrR family transcriptional regulator
MGVVRSGRSTATPAPPTLGLRAKKQAWTRDAIWDAAIDLFAARGFEAVTIEEIADAARVSRRSFFRYFESKNDLMALPIADVTAGIANALKSCPTSAPAGAVLEHVVVALAEESAADPRNAKVMKLVVKSQAAREALTSRLLTVQGQIEKAFARRFDDPVMVQTLSWMTVSALSVGTRHWFANGRRNMSVSVRKALSTVADVGREL